MDKEKRPKVQVIAEEEDKVVENCTEYNKRIKNNDAEKPQTDVQNSGGGRNQVDENLARKPITMGVDQIEASNKDQKTGSDARNHVQEDNSDDGSQYETRDEECEEIWHDEEDEDQGNFDKSIDVTHMVQTEDCPSELTTLGMNRGPGIEHCQKDLDVGDSSTR